MKDFKTLKNRPKIHKSKIRLTSYSGDKIPIHGSCVLNIEYKDKKAYFHFLIAEKKYYTYLGGKALDKLIKRVFTIAQNEQTITDDTDFECECEEMSTKEIIENYKEVFEGLGCLPGEHKIEIDENIKPVVTPCRKVAFKLRENLKQELDRMEEQNVICKENEPTEWVNAITTPLKKNCDIRVCLDPRPLNKAIKREHYKLPTREEVMSQFANAKYFSKLDASMGFWQMKLDKDSSKLTCFNTPFWQCRFLKLPFGVSCAPKKYHRTVHMMFEHIAGIDTSMDDIIVYGETIEEHNERLRQVLEIAKVIILKLNKKKCQYCVKEPTFLGDVISEEGLKADPIKIQAIQNFERPTSKQDVQRFLAMVNYQGRYLSNLSSKK